MCKSVRIKMRLFLVASILLFVVNAFPLNDPSCSLDPPYTVYEFSKVVTDLLESIPQINCDGSPVEEIIRFNCKSSDDHQFYEIDFYNRSSVEQIKKHVKWGMIVHGFLGNCFSDWPLEMMRVWTDSESINVCCVDWHKWAKCNYYVDATKYVFKVAEYLARIIYLLTNEYGVSINDIVPVGHSFGAIIVGQAGKYFRNPQIPLCIALDPAGWGFARPFFVETERRLDCTDCQIVKTLVTDSRGLGAHIPMGCVNIKANGGEIQPMCRNKHFPCSHFVAISMFIEAIRENQRNSFEIVTEDGRIRDYWTLYANDIPGNYTMKTGSCFPYSLASQPKLGEFLDGNSDEAM